MKINNFNNDDVGEIIPFMGITLKIFVPTIVLSFLKKINVQDRQIRIVPMPQYNIIERYNTPL